MNDDLEQLTKDWVLSRILQLPDDPIIVVAGAYGGKLMEWFARQYPSYKEIIGYEPALWAYEAAQQRLDLYPNIQLHNVGIGPVTGEFPMYEWGTDAQTFLLADKPDREPDHVGQVVNIYKEFNNITSYHQQPIDLLVLNCEGYEFVLAPHLPLMPIKSLAIQFHMKHCPDIATYARIIFELDQHFNQHYNYHLPSWGYWY